MKEHFYFYLSGISWVKDFWSLSVDGKEKGRLSSSVTMEKAALNMTFVPNATKLAGIIVILKPLLGATRYVTLLGRRCAHHNETWVAIIRSLVGLLLKSNSRNKMFFF